MPFGPPRSRRPPGLERDRESTISSRSATKLGCRREGGVRGRTSSVPPGRDRKTDWALRVPMFFVDRGGYQSADGATFGQFLAEGFRGHRPTMADWALHLSTLFPEARLKGYLEVRSCDAGSRPMTLALGPLLRGLLYDPDARAAAIALTADLSMDQRLELQLAVARDGLRAATATGRSVLELARELVALSRDGLRRTAPDEVHFLEPVEQVVTTGRTQADAMLELWSSSGGDRRAVIDGLAHRR